MKKRTGILGLPVPVLAFTMLAGLIGLMIFLQPAPASADEARLYLDCPTTEVREGDSVDVFLVRVITHDHWWEYFRSLLVHRRRYRRYRRLRPPGRQRPHPLELRR